MRASKGTTELGTLDWWISGLMLNPVTHIFIKH